MELQRGMRDKLDKYVDLNSPIVAEMNISGSGTYDFCCFGVDASEKLSDERYMVFYNQISTPQNEIVYSNSADVASFCVNLNSLPMLVQKLVFTVSIDGYGTMGDINNFSFTVKQNGNVVLHLALRGSDFHQEKAIIAVELYRKDSWRINTVARGFNGGLSDLLKNYGGEEAKAEPVQTPQRVNLQKGQKVSLVKGNNGLGEILINLNWKMPTGIFTQPIDLDLGCLYELKNGTKGSVQALGNNFGSLDNPPYIMLDADDRSGASSNGENLRINGRKVPEINRILVYTFIYEGTANWKGADGVVTVHCPGSPEIIVHMDDYGSSQIMCAIAMLENINDTLSVEKIVRFFHGHRDMDRAFHWGLRWVKGSK